MNPDKLAVAAAVLVLIQVAITFLACRSAHLNAKAADHWRKRVESAYEPGSILPLTPDSWREEHVKALRAKALEQMLDFATSTGEYLYRFADKLEDGKPKLVEYRDPSRFKGSYWGVIIDHKGNGVYEVRQDMENASPLYHKAVEVNGSEHVGPGTTVRCYEKSGRAHFCLPMGPSA